MGIFEIISAIILIIACVFIVVVVLMKDTKTQMSQTISGSTSDSYFQKNAGRTKEAMLNKATIAAAIVFFVLALGVNVINVYWGAGSDNNSSSAPTSSVSSDSSTGSDSTDSSDSGSDNSTSSDNSTDSESGSDTSSDSSAGTSSTTE
ncbi:MAG: preprotein translocase subunit SecG [Oscillospiraceae bacterium]|nr:preprotein translocase subunit SecG [Oscillospiraceae bacterium]